MRAKIARRMVHGKSNRLISALMVMNFRMTAGHLVAPRGPSWQAVLPGFASGADADPAKPLGTGLVAAITY